jgi:hypothetical protein
VLLKALSLVVSQDRRVLAIFFVEPLTIMLVDNARYFPEGSLARARTIVVKEGNLRAKQVDRTREKW